MVDKLKVKKDFLYVRLLFLIPWIYVIFQIFFESYTSHRFQALSKSNLALAFVYLVTFSLVPLFFAKLKAPPKSSIFVISFISLVIVISLTINNPIFVLKDTTLIIMQVVFFFIGWSFSYIFDCKSYIKTLIRDGIIFGALLGSYAFFVDYDLVSPMFGVLALAAFASVKYGREFNFYFLICLLMLNITWSFGKQTLIISFISIIIIMMSSSDLKKQQKFFYKFLYRFSMLAVSIVAILTLLNFLDTSNLRSFSKLNLLIDQIKLSVLLSGPLTADSIYEGLDMSTAGRLIELLLIWEKLTSSVPSFLFGGGFGSALDLTLKNQYTTLTYSFQETQSVQTLLAFVTSRFGFIGVFFGLYALFKQFKERRFSGNFYVPYVICLLLSLLAFSTVFKFHYISFFMGAMFYNVRIRKYQRVV